METEMKSTNSKKLQIYLYGNHQSLHVAFFFSLPLHNLVFLRHYSLTNLRFFRFFYVLSILKSFCPPHRSLSWPRQCPTYSCPKGHRSPRSHLLIPPLLVQHPPPRPVVARVPPLSLHHRPLPLCPPLLIHGPCGTWRI